jgi:hypothetical protein
MPIDPSIALGVKPVQFESPINQMAKVYELQNMQQTSQANQLAMQERQRAIAEDEAVRNYFAQQDRTSPDFAKGLYGISPKTGQAYEKFQAETSKEKTLAKNAEIEQLTKIHGVLKTGATQVLANPTLANAIRVTQDVGRMTGSDVSADLAQLTELGENPEAIRRWAAGHALEADKLLPKSERVDVGGAINYTNIDPLTGLPTVVGTTKKTQTPDSIASQNIQRANQAETARHNVVMEGQGKIPAGYRLLSDGSLETIPGGPADAKTKVAEAGQSTVDSLAATLNGYYDKLSQGGGIVSSNKRIGTNLGSSVQSSGLGQFVGGAVGTENQTTRQNILNARPLLLQAIMKATGMSAKQMDSNQELKLYLSAATDPSKSLESNKEALDNLVRLYGVGGEATPGGAKTKPIMPRNEKMPSSNPHANKSDAQIKKELGIN